MPKPRVLRPESVWNQVALAAAFLEAGVKADYHIPRLYKWVGSVRHALAGAVQMLWLSCSSAAVWLQIEGLLAAGSQLQQGTASVLAGSKRAS